jgi:ribosomal protein S18 acetylase RimI-like enzyme
MVTILPMVDTDYDEVVALWTRTEGMGLDLADADSPTAVAAYLRRNPGMSFVARDGSRVVGAVLCGHDGRRGYLHHLAVDADYRGQGLGRALVDACLAALHDAGIGKCTIFVYADNAAGQAFWTRTGWRRRDDLCFLQIWTDPARRGCPLASRACG